MTINPANPRGSHFSALKWDGRGEPLQTNERRVYVNDGPLCQFSRGMLEKEAAPGRGFGRRLPLVTQAGEDSNSCLETPARHSDCSRGDCYLPTGATRRRAAAAQAQSGGGSCPAVGPGVARPDSLISHVGRTLRFEDAEF
ncbi:hypothetical protein NDU88_005083 [Pleurodeles waltl]|uniref:Uncharacterized protein n=1 Tax=Pleurodeles waltl TaxID=8319 RepID=A0AAV7L068_PLEWA|nr:hypothetical protein NDU88_005083 [Pleurodeles waltl]